MTSNPALNTLGVNKVKWNQNSKNTKLILHDKTHAIIAFPGQDFINMGTKPDLYESQPFKNRMVDESYLGQTASKFVTNQFM